MVASLAVAVAVAGAAATTTTEVRRIVGDPLPTWVVVGAGLAVLGVIVVAGLLARRCR